MMFTPDDAKLHAKLNAYRTLGCLDTMIDMLGAMVWNMDPDTTPADYCPSFEKYLAEAYEKMDQALQLLHDARSNLYTRTEAVE